MEVGLSLNAVVRLPLSSSRTHEDGLVRHSLVSTKTTTQKAAEQRQVRRALVVGSKGKRGMMARQFQPKKPPPPAMPKIEDDGNPRFVVFIRMANVCFLSLSPCLPLALSPLFLLIDKFVAWTGLPMVPT